MRNIYLAVSQGILYRNFVRLGFLRHLLDSAPDIRVILLTQASAVEDVQKETAHERLVLAHHDLFSSGRQLSRLIAYRRNAKWRWLSRLFHRLEVRLAAPPHGLAELFRQYPPDLVVSTHPYVIWEWDIITYARKMGYPTLGVVKSWDNLLRKLAILPHRLAVWSEANRQEAIDLSGYRKEDVDIVGSLAFDRYFKPAVLKLRAEFWRSMDLDPAKPVILFGTAGSFSPDWDETFMMDVLLDLAEKTAELQDVQFVCRLHPITHLEYFWPYRNHPRVRLSFGSYVKTLGWCMTRDEVDEMANLLAHADLIITPASTLTLEGPIFDTPTIVTLFSTVRPELHAAATRRDWLDMHFRPIADNNWLPLADDVDELRRMVITALADPGWYRARRRQLVNHFVHFTDGCSYRRLAELIHRLSAQKLPGRD